MQRNVGRDLLPHSEGGRHHHCTAMALINLRGKPGIQRVKLGGRIPQGRHAMRRKHGLFMDEGGDAGAVAGGEEVQIGRAAGVLLAGLAAVADEGLEPGTDVPRGMTPLSSG